MGMKCLSTHHGSVLDGWMDEDRAVGCCFVMEWQTKQGLDILTPLPSIMARAYGL